MTSSIYAALLGLMLIGLSVFVVKGRRKFKVGLGDSEQIEMKRRIRAQANFIEYSPMFLILLAFAEHGGLPILFIHLFGLIFIIGRIMHAFSILKAEQYDNQDRLISKPVWRIRGMICTMSCLGLLAICILSENILRL